MDTSQNSSQSIITQRVTGILVSRICNRLWAERRRRRLNSLRRFALSLQRVSKCPTAGSTDAIIILLSKLFLWPSAQFSCFHLLITEICNDLYFGSVRKKYCFCRRHSTADIRKSQIVARLFTANLILLVFAA